MPASARGAFPAHRRDGYPGRIAGGRMMTRREHHAREKLDKQTAENGGNGFCNQVRDPRTKANARSLIFSPRSASRRTVRSALPVASDVAAVKDGRVAKFAT
jgi:hypothetical protein